ncbi:hypothetical protein HW555_010819 [Spodoptera exigua]|uniref:Uncharacterized protein n=1 Tax=Spodoptera exigua TaxID=7107 RepID=A0A835GAI3_SPOEX|nr:hypothetical protein HW555_010819 [Spodoptera exigua]
MYEGNYPPRRDFGSSKWLSNRAMDVWYGNKTMIEVLSSEFSNILMKLTGGRGGRSALQFHNSTDSINSTVALQNETDIIFPMVNVDSFMNDSNKKTQLIHLIPMRNSTVFKLLAPILEVPEH